MDVAGQSTLARMTAQLGECARRLESLHEENTRLRQTLDDIVEDVQLSEYDDLLLITVRHINNAADVLGRKRGGPCT